ncbi:hypothetical protein ACLOJK_023375 [Asimina triloba]
MSEVSYLTTTETLSKQILLYKEGSSHDIRRASEGGRMHIRADAGETSIPNMSAARHGRDPRRITHAGHRAGRACYMRRHSDARLNEHTGRSECELEAYCSWMTRHRVWNHYVASRWYVTGQTLD